MATRARALSAAELRERLQGQLQGIHKDLMPKIDIKVSQLDLGTTAISRIAAHVAKIGWIRCQSCL